MSIGVPVISSNTSSLPEIVENAGILLSPSDELSWVRSIKSILSDRKLHNRYSKLGLIQSQKFSWAKTAAETLMVYKELQ
ncbi:MAG: glycosyl transferase, group 1 [uncultured bacterium]|nr:MAG: glycosyl transferase, group 1 [uncultured bacterium]